MTPEDLLDQLRAEADRLARLKAQIRVERIRLEAAVERAQALAS